MALEKLTTSMLAEKLGLNLEERRLGYTIKNNPNKLMSEPIKFITVHQTDNTDVGADADRHHSYLRNGSGGTKTSWHYTVDEKGAIQSFRDNRVMWHCADDVGNATSLSMELCVDADKIGEPMMGRENYQKTVLNAQKLLAIKLYEHGLKVTDIVQHNNWNGKNCPREIRAGAYGITWSVFLSGVQKQVDELNKILNPKKPVSTTQATDGKLFIVKIGAYKSRENAEALIKEAQEKGFNAYMTIDNDPKAVTK